MKNFSIPEGFQVTSGSIGLRKFKDDIAIINSEKSVKCAAVFTQNKFAAAPILVSKKHLKKTNFYTKAVLINTAYANACTGYQGIKDAKKCVNIVSKNLNCNLSEVLVFSTGKIGVKLPMEKFEIGLPKLCQNFNNDISKFGKAILTTDLVSKIEYQKIGDTKILGFAKGSGMIAPNMATMLAFILTDAKINQFELQKMWTEICNKTFNMISVDACESTNDVALVLSSNLKLVDKNLFKKALHKIAKNLAKKIATDGEGAKYLIEVKTCNCSNQKSAEELAKSIVKSDLVKTAVTGKDVNWGRVCSAIGSAGFDFPINKVSIYFDSECVFKNGKPLEFNKQNIFKNKVVKIAVDFKNGKCSATAWGCDLTHGYIDINSKYST